MVFFLATGKLTDRDYSPLNTIVLTAFLFLLADPTSLEDASFQMTFACSGSRRGNRHSCRLGGR
jgi:predicted membrane metal-binding protein